MSSISIDAGTSTIKAVAYGDDGAEVAVCRRPTRVLRPAPGHAEQDMDEVWTAVAEVMAAVLHEAGNRIGTPDFVAVTAQGDGAWLVDGAGRPTGPAVLWNDGRGVGVLAGWEQDGTAAKALAVTGSRLSTGMPNAVLAWLALHQPERLTASATVLTCGGWVFHKLTGEFVVDESEAAAPWLDVATRRWSPELLDLYGQPWAARLLPRLVDDDHRVAGLSPAAAAATGLPVGLPVVLAPYDVCATAIGSGVVSVGQACCVLGTTYSTEVVLDRLDRGDDRSSGGITVPLGAPGRWLRAYPTMAGGDVLVWAAGLLGVGDAGALLALAATVDGPGGARFLPYVSPAGERNPFLDPAARGSLTGMSLEDTPAHVAHAVVLGLAHTVRECLEATGTSPSVLVLCGGSAVDPWWRRLIGDVTGTPTAASLDREVGARGAQLVGVVATGSAPDLETAVARHVVTTPPLDPDPACSARCDEGFAAFLATRAVVRPLWHGAGGTS